MSASKQTAFDYIDEKSGVITDVSDKIWDYAELSLREYKSGELYAKVLKEEGFTVEHPFDNIETAFRASYGSGKPVIGDRANLGTGEFAVSPADQSAMSHLTPSGAGDRADITEPYDQALVNQPYPYKIWTTGADGKKVYHGDWLDVSGLKD